MLNIKKKTKIICTVGPASDNLESIRELLKAGMNVIRLNFSHGTYESHKKIIDLARSFEKEHLYIPIMMDTKGPEIRCHFFAEGKAKITKDSVVTIQMNEVLGTATNFSVNYAELVHDLKVGDEIKIDDGKLRLDVTKVDKANGVITTVAYNTHTVRDRTGVNIPTARLTLPALSDIDKADIAFAVKENIDLIAASFIRSGDDIREIKAYLNELGAPAVSLIAKIENQEGVDNLNDILNEADGVMVARGDMGVEIASELVPLMQSEIILASRKLGKPVIIATQMLDSMQSNPTPTRAEVSDVATAIKEGADAVMLSGETATGLYPILAAEMQQKIAIAMESQLPYTQLANFAYNYSKKERSDAIATSVASTANLIDAHAIFCFSETGQSAIRISVSRPKCPIIMVTASKKAAMRVAPYFGIIPVVVRKLPQLIEDMEAFSLIKARQLNLTPKDNLIITGGTPTGVGGTNFLRIVALNEVREF